MIRLIDLLNEGKQVGLLYHYTSEKGLKGILQSNELYDTTARHNKRNGYDRSFERIEQRKSISRN